MQTKVGGEKWRKGPLSHFIGKNKRIKKLKKQLKVTWIKCSDKSENKLLWQEKIVKIIKVASQQLIHATYNCYMMSRFILSKKKNYL